MGASLEQFAYDLAVTLFGRQMQRVQAVRIAGVDVGSAAQQFQHLIEITGTGGSQKTRTRAAFTLLEKKRRH